MLRQRTTLFSLIILFLSILGLLGCTLVRDKSPASTSHDTISNVGSLVAAPEAYGGQAIVLYGNVERACPSDGCYFYLNDGTGSINVDLKGITSRISDNRNGKPIKVYGKFVSIGSIPYVAATKIELQ